MPGLSCICSQMDHDIIGIYLDTWHLVWAGDVMALFDLFWLCHNKPYALTRYIFCTPACIPAIAPTYYQQIAALRSKSVHFPFLPFSARRRYRAASSGAKKVWTTPIWKCTQPCYLLSFPFLLQFSVYRDIGDTLAFLCCPVVTRSWQMFNNNNKSGTSKINLRK